jgi:hypothetical protein
MKLNKLINMQKPFQAKGIAGFAISFILFAFLITFTACEKDNDDDFKADFSFEYAENNHVLFTNLSEGEYYWMMWDYGNGIYDTTADKKEVFDVYFPEGAKEGNQVFIERVVQQGWVIKEEK